MTFIFEKSQRRRSVLRGISKDVFDETTKEKCAKALVSEMMSSEDEQEDWNGQLYFLVHKPTFRTETFEKPIKIIDGSYLENCSKRSKDQMIRREVVASIVQSPPSLKFGSNILIKR